ncbi:class IV lanthionine synthetase LanL [Nocardia sp. NEAU-G5]|uniref:non-specific serine/threonine protein kinase n=1 Tax=Nocardia albiluteola TaxID=2842303 RepID=A0ABS6B2Y7_9NOCA|nr:class IV lanthionine synthetase LanL [Nocardia albiluteola]MBU3064647.1 class IV lanthionine synthetase LanL [Nocardia albiluteola]
MVEFDPALEPEGEDSASWNIEGRIRRALVADIGGRWSFRADDEWNYVVPQAGLPRPQGWKLHISGTVLSAREILDRVLPVLVSGRSAFKIARGLAYLESLSDMHSARESAGKFITVYPPDDDTCGALAAELDARLTGLYGPVVLSDLPYRPGSLVSCRYGAFRAMYTVSAAGDLRPAITSPDGERVEDRRRPWFEFPPWTTPPEAFRQPHRAAGGGPARGRSGGVLLADRFLVGQALRLTAKGGVYLARDLKSDNADALVVVKQARPHIGAGADGLDARSFLGNEWSVLHLLAATGVTPAPVALFQHDGDLFLAEEYVRGTRLDRWARRFQPGPYGGDGSDSALSAAVSRLCAAIGAFHSRGLVIRDLSPTNLLVEDSSEGPTIRICDVEYAAFSGTAPRIVGTPGFNAPEQRAGKPARPANDLYSLGAVLYYMCTGRAPQLAAEDAPARPSAARLSELLARGAPSRQLAAVTGLIVALLDDDPTARPSLHEVTSQLGSWVTAGPAGTEVHTEEGPRTLAADLVEHLVATWTPGSPRPWNFGDYRKHETPLDVYSGVAGVVGVLARAAATGNHPGVPPVLAEAAAWLADHHQPDGVRQPGLMVGDAGIAWALGLAYAAARPGHRPPSPAIMTRLPSAPPSNDEFLYGTAGSIVAHAGLLQGAAAFGLTPAEAGAIRDRLVVLCADLAARQASIEEGSPAGAPDAVTDHGFAHGTAGIGYGLLVGGAMLDDEALIGQALECGRRIGKAALHRDDQAWWAEGSPNAPLYRGHWCHGSSGIATFLVRLWWFTGDEQSLATARAAARAVLAGRTGAPACACHGLSGDGELLLDLAAATGEAHYREAARSIGNQLWGMRVRREGRWLVPDADRAGISVSYALGTGGVASFLLRLLHGGRRPWTADDVPHGPRRAGFPAFESGSERR